MTKFRFPGRTSRNAINRTRVPGIRQGSDEAAISAEKIYLAYMGWQHFFGNSDDEDLEGFESSEAQQAVSSSVEYANNSNLESEDFIERVQEIQELQQRHAKLNGTSSRLRKQLPATTTNDTALRKFVLPSRSSHSSRTIIPNKKFSDEETEETENETENSSQKHLTVKSEPQTKVKRERETSQRSSKSEKRLCKNSNLIASKKFKNNTDLSPKNSSIILKPSTLKLESFKSGYTLGSSWIQSSTLTVKPTSLPVAKGCLICERMTSLPDCQCDWCHDFMDKMTSKNIQKTMCLRGRGICKVANMELKARCQACWLACCLNKLPVAQKTLSRLKKLLPTSLQHQIGTGIPVKKDPLRGWSDNISNQTQIAARALMKKATKTANNKNKVVVTVETSKKKHKTKDKPKRQKAHLKGPRIKHVCRRACVVLGQPQALFPVSPSSKSADGGKKRKDSGDSRSKGDKKVGKTVPEERPTTPLMLPLDQLGLPPPPPSKTDAPPGWVCLDFDPQEGSGVPVMSSVGSTALPPALCLLCGSAGKEQLLFCAMCCEPYHVYCLEVTPQLNKMWVCERCELCVECNSPTQHHEEVTRCHKCAAPYHKHCLSVKPSQRPWECPSCNVCRSCGAAANNMRHVGNTAFCAPCYKLRLKGNFCPLCQQCYQDNDYDTKMVECAECLSWVHARCEGISDEKYEILSFLPESVEFHCQNCSTQSPPIWYVAVENEIKSGVVNIVKNLAKYRSIKFSPHKKVSEDILGSQEPVETCLEPTRVESEKKKLPLATKSPEKASTSATRSETIQVQEKAPTVVPENVNDEPKITKDSHVNETETVVKVVADKSSKPNEKLDIQVSDLKVPEDNKPNENLKSEVSVQIIENSNINTGASNVINTTKENQEILKDPKVEAAKIKLDFSEETLKLPRLVVRLTDYAKHKPKATQTLKLKQICDAYNIKECSVHLRKCNSQLNLDKVDLNKTPDKDNRTTNELTQEEKNEETSKSPERESTDQIITPTKPKIELDVDFPMIKSPTYKTPDKNANYDIKLQAPIEVRLTRMITSEPFVEPQMESETKEKQVEGTKEQPATGTPKLTTPKSESHDGKDMSPKLKTTQSDAKDSKAVEVKKEIGVIEVETKGKSLEAKPAESPNFKKPECHQLDVKQLAATLRKASLGVYESLISFDLEFQNEILKSTSVELKEQYLKLLTERFPWYKPGAKAESPGAEKVITKMEPQAVVKDKSDGTAKIESDKSWSQLYIPEFHDERVCALCKRVADSAVLGGERMLHTGVAPPLDWVHANCALWSSEVWEDRDGFLHSLMPGALTRATRTKCGLCGNKGASVGCCHANSCPNSYHWPCAVSLLEGEEAGRVLLDQVDMSLFCPEHAAEHAEDEEEAVDAEGSTKQTFALPRKLRVEPPRNKKRFADPLKVQIAVGSLRVESLGVLSSSLCHDEVRDVLVPDGYVARRLYWSTKEPWRIVEYLILTELEPESSVEEGLARDINLTVEHGSHGAPQEVMEKNLRVLRHIQQHEIDQMAKDSEMNLGSKENADDLLLPPDLKETIFQDLNSELLDGISMQDIFTKLLSEDAIKEEVLSDSEELSLSSNPVREVIDCILDQVCLLESPFESKSRKRMLRSPTSDLEDFQNRTKIPRTNSYGNLDYFSSHKLRIPQLDGADDSSSDSESASKSDDMKVEVETSLTRKIKERSLAASEPGLEGPVRCKSCKRTYRTKTSYDKHMPSCTEISSDSSDESTESPTTSRMTAKTSKYGTVVLTTKVVLVQSPDKASQKRKAAKLVRRTVKLAAKPTPTSSAPPPAEPPQPVQHIAVETPAPFNHQNIVYQDQQPMIVGQNPIFLTQPTNTVYYINLTPNKQNNYFLVNNPENNSVMYVQAPEQVSDHMHQNPIILQQAPGFGNVMTLNPSYNPSPVNPAFCQSQLNTAFLPPMNHHNITYNPSQQAFAQAFGQTCDPTIHQPLANQLVNTNPGGIFLNPNPGVSPQTFTINQATNQAYLTAAVTPSLNTNLGQNTITSGLNLNTQETPVQIVTPEKLQEQTYVMHTPNLTQTNSQPIKTENISTTPTMTQHTNIQDNLCVVNPTIIANPELLKPSQTMRQDNHNLISNQSMINNTTLPKQMEQQSMQSMINSLQVPVSSHNNRIGMQTLPTLPTYTIQSSDVRLPPIPSSPLHVHNMHQISPNSHHISPNTHQIPTHHITPNRQSNNMLPIGPYYSSAANQIPQSPAMTVTSMSQTTHPVPSYYQTPLQIPGISNQQQHQIHLRHNYNLMQQHQQQQQHRPQLQQQQQIQNQIMTQNYHMKQNSQGLIHIASYKRPLSTNTLSGNMTRMSHVHGLNSTMTSSGQRPRAPVMSTVATATRLYVQPPLKTYTNNQSSKAIVKPNIASQSSPCRIAPQLESKVVKITASASVGTQTTQRCATPNLVKKEPIDIEDKTGIKFKIQSSDGYTTVATNVSQAWQNIFEAVQKARRAYNLAPLPYNPFSLTGQHLTGLGQDPIKFLIEQLPGVSQCSNYTPQFHNRKKIDPTKIRVKEPKLNPTGCARTEAFKTRNPYDMFGWLASAHRKPPPITVTESETVSRRASNSLPMAMRFRQLKNNVRVKVGVFRSLIHGRGLFCLRELEPAEMVIEYAGEVIRSSLTDKREKVYESRGIGCYMFRVDDQTVVDATMKGNAARFINHSCEPNCYSRVVDVLGKKHILIFALRRILPGEELTYDYKFPFEEDKIPCTCASRRCRKYLN